MIKKILMVDDDTDDRDILQHAFATIDPALLFAFAGTADEAVKQLELLARPDVIFLDFLLPGMDGIECLTKLKANRRTRQIPVIIYTGTADKSENELAIRLGAFQVLQKGSGQTLLCDELRAILSHLEKEEKVLH